MSCHQPWGEKPKVGWVERIQMCIKSFFFLVNYSSADIGGGKETKKEGMEEMYLQDDCILLKSVKMN